MTVWRCFGFLPRFGVEFFWRRRIGVMADHRHHSEGEHHQGNVAMPSMPRSALVVIEPELVFRGLKTVLDRPSMAFDRHQPRMHLSSRAPFGLRQAATNSSRSQSRWAPPGARKMQGGAFRRQCRRDQLAASPLAVGKHEYAQPRHVSARKEEMIGVITPPLRRVAQHVLAGRVKIFHAEQTPPGHPRTLGTPSVQ
jgi:hypothetical protein